LLVRPPAKCKSGSPWARVDEINGRAVRIPWECKPLCRKGGNGSERRRRGQAVRPRWAPLRQRSPCSAPSAGRGFVRRAGAS